MPYRHLFHQEQTSHDLQGHYALHGLRPPLSIVDQDSIDYTGWHEMDFTTTPLTSSALEINANQSPGLKYPTSPTMDRDQAFLLRSASNHRHGSTGSNLINPASRSQSSISRRASGDVFHGAQYSFSQLLNMGATTSPLDRSNNSSRATDDDANMTNNDLSTALSASDSIDSSPPMNTLDPIAISIAVGTDTTGEKLCPLIAGQVDSCQPARCGPDAPCMNFTTLPPIEECTSGPCIASSPNSTIEISFNTEDAVSAELRLLPRPNMSKRNSTATTTRSSNIRRSFSSTATTIDSQPDVGALSPRRSIANTNRQTCASHQAISIPTALLSDNDDAEEEQPTPPRTGKKPTAPSKLDAKQRAKQAHSLVERKYRENLNAKIMQLYSTLHNSHYGPRLGADDSTDLQGLDDGLGGGITSGGSSKVRKSDVLTEAMNYVNQTEVEMRHMENEIHRLGERVRVLEKLVRCDDCSVLKQMVSLQMQGVQV